MRAKILRASQATSGMSGINDPGLAVEAELADGSNVRLYVREGWAFDLMAINGELKPVSDEIMSAVAAALAGGIVRLDMSYAEYLNWIPGRAHDYRYGSFEDWQRLNGIEPTD